jgi:DNA-binding MarR family transcriptional regulator
MNYNEMAENFFELASLHFKKSGLHKAISFGEGEMCILLILEEYQKDHTALPKELASLSENSMARISNILSTLEKKELIRRKIDDDNRRQIIINITKKGLLKISKEKENAKKYFSAIFQKMGEKNAGKFIEGIHSFIEAENKICEYRKGQ